VWNHLARHLRDADVEPPELKAIEDAGDGDSDTAGDGEGQTGNGEPSGAPPRVISAQIDINLMEAEL
jgi:hypothetical protein